jgi:hypothetical protein
MDSGSSCFVPAWTSNFPGCPSIPDTGYNKKQQKPPFLLLFLQFVPDYSAISKCVLPLFSSSVSFRSIKPGHNGFLQGYRR